MRTGSLFDHGNGASNATGRLKKAQQYNRICEIGDIDRGFHVADKSMLGNRQKCGYA
jgi:hypothetical protein